MDKIHERDQLRRVFGVISSEAQDHERPDFLLKIEGKRKLGIEVTSIYTSNADAKLKLVPNYTNALLSKQQGVHQSDRGQISVEDLSLLDPDGAVVETITGIVQEMPSKKSAYEILFSKIQEKEAKVDEYLRYCDEVDLIIEDGSNLFRHQTHDEFYKYFHLFSPKAQLICSRFREIYLIVATGLNSVYVPLIANTFFADCLAYEHLLWPSVEAGRPSQEIFEVLAACLCHDGYSQRVRMTSRPDGVGIFCGAWELFHAEDSREIRDWSIPMAPYEGESLIVTVSSLAPELLEEARSLSEARRSLFSAMDVRLPTHRT